jgi:hypothetical protein
MALTPGGGRSPSTKPPSAPPPTAGQTRPGRDQRIPRVTPRAAAISIVRWGVLLGGLVIIADLAAMAAFQRTVSPDDLAAIQTVDDIANYGLFSFLGVVVVRDTGLFYAGILGGLLASLLDSAVVAAARIMAPIAGVSAPIEDVFVTNLVIGVVFAGVSGLMYVLVRRWSGGRSIR